MDIPIYEKQATQLRSCIRKTISMVVCRMVNANNRIIDADFLKEFNYKLLSKRRGYVGKELRKLNRKYKN